MANINIATNGRITVETDEEDLFHFEGSRLVQSPPLNPPLEWGIEDEDDEDIIDQETNFQLPFNENFTDEGVKVEKGKTKPKKCGVCGAKKCVCAALKKKNKNKK